MGGISKLLIAMIVVWVAIGTRGQWVGAQIHHVVGGDRGWDPSSDIPFWASTRIFSVGDKIWFTYSAAQENIVELTSKEEYEACDVSNPIKMYTNGLDSVPLEEEGIRYFASGKPESCKNGLRVHVEVQPQAKHHHHISAVVTSEGSAGATADAPASPSASTRRISGLSYLLFVGILLCPLVNQGL